MKWIQALLDSVPADYQDQLEPAQPGEKMLGQGSPELLRLMRVGSWMVDRLKEDREAHRKLHRDGVAHERSLCEAHNRDMEDRINRLEILNAAVAAEACYEFGLPAGSALCNRSDGIVQVELPPQEEESPLDGLLRAIQGTGAVVLGVREVGPGTDRPGDAFPVNPKKSTSH